MSKICLLICVFWVAISAQVKGDDSLGASVSQEIDTLSRLGVLTEESRKAQVVFNFERFEDLIHSLYSHDSFDPDVGDGEYGLFNSGAQYFYSHEHSRFEIRKNSGLSNRRQPLWSGKFLNWLTARRIDLIQQFLTGRSQVSSGHSVSLRSDLYIVKRAEKSRDFSPITSFSPVKVHVDHFFYNGVRYQIDVQSPAYKTPYIDPEDMGSRYGMVDKEGLLISGNLKVTEEIQQMKTALFDGYGVFSKSNAKSFDSSILAQIFTLFKKAKHEKANGSNGCQRVLLIEFLTRSYPSEISRFLENRDKDCLPNKVGIQQLDYLGINLIERIRSNDRVGFEGGYRNAVSQPLLRIDQLKGVSNWQWHYDALLGLYLAQEGVNDLYVPNSEKSILSVNEHKVVVQGFSVASAKKDGDFGAHGELVAYWLDEAGRYRIDNGDLHLGSSREDKYLHYCFDSSQLQTRFIVSEQIADIDRAKTARGCNQVEYPYAINDIEFLWRHKLRGVGGFSLGKPVSPDLQNLFIVSDSGELVRLDIEPLLKGDRKGSDSNLLWRFQPDGRVVNSSQPYITSIPISEEHDDGFSLDAIDVNKDGSNWGRILIYPVFVHRDGSLSKSNNSAKTSLHIYIFDIGRSDLPPKLIKSISLNKPVSKTIFPQIVSIPKKRSRKSNKDLSLEVGIALCLFEGKSDLQLKQELIALPSSSHIDCFEIDTGRSLNLIEKENDITFGSYVTGVSAFDGDGDGVTDAVFVAMNQLDGQGGYLYRLSNQPNFKGESFFKRLKVYESEYSFVGEPVLLDVSKDKVGVILSQNHAIQGGALLGVLLDRSEENLSKIVKQNDLIKLDAQSVISEILLEETKGWMFPLESNEVVTNAPKSVLGHIEVPYQELLPLDACRHYYAESLLQITNIYSTIGNGSVENNSGIVNKLLKKAGINREKRLSVVSENKLSDSALKVHRIEGGADELIPVDSLDKAIILEPLSWTIR